MYLESIEAYKNFVKNIISLESEMDDGLSSCSNFPEKPAPKELDMDELELPEK